jgi:hypothetical protein
LVDADNIIAGQTIFAALIYGKLDAIEAVQAIHGAKPQKALFVFKYAGNLVIGEAMISSVPPERVIGRLAGSEKANQQ